MRSAISVAPDHDWHETLPYVREAEHLGVDVVWVPEAWGYDAAAPLGYLAAVTDRMLIGAGIFQVGVRSAAMTAQTAASLAVMSGGRFLLGLGVSGPQVIEGLHGVEFARPLLRLRETIEVIRLALNGSKVVYDGATIQLPRPDGEGKALRLAVQPQPFMPLYLATLSPRMLQLTGELADGWLGTAFIPERAEAFLGDIAAGAARSGRTLADIDISQGGEVAFGDDVSDMVAARKPGLAFTLGGMGSSTTNFYNDAYSRQGWAEVAAEVRRLWTEGRREAAAGMIPDEMVLQTTMIGTPEMVRNRMRVWRDQGINTLRLYPAGETLSDRLDTLGAALGIITDLNREEPDIGSA